MEDNLKLRTAQKEIETCEKELTDINEKLSGVNVEMISEKEPLIIQQTKIFREKAQTEGKLGELKVCIYYKNKNNRKTKYTTYWQINASNN